MRCRSSISRGSAASVPSGLKLDAHRHDQVARVGERRPARFQHCADARAQRVDLVLRQRRGACRSRVPSEGVLFSVSPVAAWRCGSRLSSSAAMRFASNFGCGFGGSAFFSGFGVLGLLLLLLRLGLLGLVLLQRLGDRIDLRLRLLRERLLRLGLRLLRRRRLRLGLLRLRRAAWAAAPDRPSARSPASRTIFAVGFSTGFASATFSTSGFGVSAFGAVLDAVRHLREVGRPR